MIFQPPPEVRAAVRVNGVATVKFPGKSFSRDVREIYVETSIVSPVEIYLGIIAPSGKRGGNPIGNRNTFNPSSKLEIPPGMELFVVWPSNTTGTAFAKLECDGTM